MREDERTGQLSIFEDEDLEYKAFTEKFKPKKTTDDCYTPEPVYNAIRDWACSEYGRAPDSIVRPFWPGGDYERFDYPPGCLVLDNPPFSILSKIEAFYLDREIDFFLFAPTLTCISRKDITHLITCANITYQNGAVVPTSFVTNLGGDVAIKSEVRLTEIINGVQKNAKKKKEVPKYAYPHNVVTAAMVQLYARRGVEFEVKKSDAYRISALDSQRRSGKAIFGGGYLVSDRAAADRAAADRAAADRAAAEIWELSPRELYEIEALNRNSRAGEDDAKGGK